MLNAPSPNTITLARFPILVVCLAILYHGTPALRLAGVGLLGAGLLLDTVDGIVARRTGRTTLLGSVLDIAADRAYELTLWVAFADLDLVPVAIPLIVIVRTTLTDAIRAAGVARGDAPLAQPRAGLARVLVASSAMRTIYSAAKMVAFCGLALVPALESGSAAGPGGGPEMLGLFRALAWLTVSLCLLRGAPVVAGLLRLTGAPRGYRRLDGGTIPLSRR